jgi:hypothetical protein
MFNQRESEMLEARKAAIDREKIEEDEAIEALLSKYADVVNTFLAIAERKVSVLDEYGDERMHLLGREVDDCVAKIAGREGKNELQVKAALKKGGFYIHKEENRYLLRIREILPAMFATYHADRKGKQKTIKELASLSSLQFAGETPALCILRLDKVIQYRRRHSRVRRHWRDSHCSLLYGYALLTHSAAPLSVPSG